MSNLEKKNYKIKFILLLWHNYSAVFEEKGE